MIPKKLIMFYGFIFLAIVFILYFLFGRVKDAALAVGNTVSTSATNSSVFASNIHPVGLIAQGAGRIVDILRDRWYDDD